MSDKASLSDIATARQAGRITSPNERDKAPRRDSPCAGDSRRSRRSLADPPADRAGARPCAARHACASQGESGENPGTASLSAAGADPGLGAGERKGRGGRSAVFRRRRARASRRLLRADPPAAGALRSRLALQSAAASAKILRLNADEAALRDLRFAVGDPRGPAANLLSLWRDARQPAAQPRPRPDSRRGGAARPGSWTRTASQRA